MWATFSGCECIQHILRNCGYDNMYSLNCINEINFAEIENYVDENRTKILDFNSTCTHKAYDKQNKFQFLPGHRMLILKWCSELQSCKIPNELSNEFSVNHPAFSPMLKEIIVSALSNHNKVQTARRYTKLIFQHTYTF